MGLTSAICERGVFVSLKRLDVYILAIIWRLVSDSLVLPQLGLLNQHEEKLLKNE